MKFTGLKYIAGILFTLLCSCSTRIPYAGLASKNVFSDNGLVSIFRNDSLRLFMLGSLASTGNPPVAARLKAISKYVRKQIPAVYAPHWLSLSAIPYSADWFFAGVVVDGDVGTAPFFTDHYSRSFPPARGNSNYGKRKLVLPDSGNILYDGKMLSSDKYVVSDYALRLGTKTFFGYAFAFRRTQKSRSDDDGIDPGIDSSHYFDVCRVNTAYPTNRDIFDFNDFLQATDSNISHRDYYRSMVSLKHYESVKDIDYYLDDVKNLIYSFMDATDSIHLIDETERYHIPATGNTSVGRFSDLSALLAATARYQVVAFNENHYDWRNRYLVYGLLDTLKSQGFTSLALETLSYHDSSLLSRGFPVQKTGYYQREPFMAELIRKALKLGYTLIAYEDTTSYPKKSKNTMTRWQWREYHEAVNFQKALKTAKGKTIVLAGYDHINKNDKKGSFIQFAEQFGAGPCLSINQTHLSDFYSDAKEQLKQFPPSYYLVDSSCVSPE
ncbi:MAG: hypothetical protein QM664_07040 [Flavihumibacter sp.]